MSEVQQAASDSNAQQRGLFLLFQLGDERYACDVASVVEVLSVPALRPLAGMPDWVAGIFVHDDQVVPVLDLCALTLGRPARRQTSTRLLLSRYGREGQQGSAAVAQNSAPLFGVLVERATATLRCGVHEFSQHGLEQREKDYLGPVRRDERGLVQRVSIQRLLTEEVHSLLFPADKLLVLTPSAAAGETSS
ncbi:chemotaxis protein CheW [Pokkaliibacter plantistimulans]|uniref:Chemotaxis protein CheW n=1 Tax=Proteobacteria bacterium 228 TaxID=2083153 RepID=A0A2S5KMT0_9PROT|nr:chemotaxis protein CheW [Pokkaliibacter plantistimulans]PPC75616.1 chemotaxis protein CheW [Pokkaliibacter plantistimulans]